jgi:hypothetical protein
LIRYARATLSLPMGDLIDGRTQEDPKSRKEIVA